MTTFRYYDPANGRFLNRDPIGYKGGVNLYNYCDNDAGRLADPSGFLGVILTGGGGAVGGVWYGAGLQGSANGGVFWSPTSGLSAGGYGTYAGWFNVPGSAASLPPPTSGLQNVAIGGDFSSEVGITVTTAGNVAQTSGTSYNGQINIAFPEGVSVGISYSPSSGVLSGTILFSAGLAAGVSGYTSNTVPLGSTPISGPLNGGRAPGRPGSACGKSSVGR